MSSLKKMLMGRYCHHEELSWIELSYELLIGENEARKLIRQSMAGKRGRLKGLKLNDFVELVELNLTMR